MARRLALEAEVPQFRAGKRLWSALEDGVVRELYPNVKTERLAAVLRRPLSSVYQRAAFLGLKKSAKYLASADACRLRRGQGAGKQFRFTPGHTRSWNKGKRMPGYGPGRMRETQFKPGDRKGIAATNWRPIGTIAIDSDGYQRIKVREACPGEAYGFGNSRVWPMLNRHLWTEAHGPVPPGHAVVFKDGDRTHCVLENLQLISRRELMARNTVHNLPAPLPQTIQLLGALKRQINRRSHAR